MSEFFPAPNQIDWTAVGQAGQVLAAETHQSKMHGAIQSFAQQQTRLMVKQLVAENLFKDHHAWAIESVWERPEIWVPVIDGVRRCKATWLDATFVTTKETSIGQEMSWNLPPWRRQYSIFHMTCGRRNGHGGRCTAYGDTDHTGKLRRVVAVWPSRP